MSIDRDMFKNLNFKEVINDFTYFQSRKVPLQSK